MSGLRPALRLRYLLLAITVLASIAGILFTQQVGHPPAANSHAAIPVLIDGVASAGTSALADPALPPDEEDQQSPAGGIHLQLCLAALAGALGLLLKLGPRKSPLPDDSDCGPPSRTGIQAATSARAPAPVLSSTCVLRV
ncbi:hypothetical protein [Rhodococcus opacus]|uniref:hypothetical protein n=1 Tax=Rhodococcus opacus TaxID=37919 RepID=UPI001C442703|nr:hypothetical protein [Rhodococcus opacus]MBV6760581.1 hypothetical protein [Rhodococcus opacus]